MASQDFRKDGDYHLNEENGVREYIANLKRIYEQATSAKIYGRKVRFGKNEHKSITGTYPILLLYFLLMNYY